MDFIDTVIELLVTSLKVDSVWSGFVFLFVMFFSVFQFFQKRSQRAILNEKDKENSDMGKDKLFIYKKSLELASIAKQANVMDMKTRIKEVDEIMKEIRDRV